MEENNLIVSFTSYPERFRFCPQVIESILINTVQPYKICLTIYKDYINDIPSELQEYINDGSVELIVADENLESHNKYYYVMQKYRENPILTIDDDYQYHVKLVESMLKAREKYGDNYILANRVNRIIYDENGITEIKKWEQQIKYITYPSYNLVAIGCGGVLYPADIFHITEDNLPEIRQCLYNDDIYLHYLEHKNIIPVLFTNIKENFWPKKIIDAQENGLFNTINYPLDKNNETDKAINLFLKRHTENILEA